MCSYHGWRFQGDGKCTDIPQALDENAKAAACSSPKSCASARPTQVGITGTPSWKMAFVSESFSTSAYPSCRMRLLTASCGYLLGADNGRMY